MSAKSKEEILAVFHRFMDELGENPLEDQHKAFAPMEVFMSWCLEKGYTTQEQYDRFLEDLKEGNLEFFQLFGEPDETDFAYVCSEHTGYDYLAEFVASSDDYIALFHKNYVLE